MVSGVAHRRVEGLHGVPDPALRPGALPEPWSRLDWRPLAPARNASKPRLFWAQDGGRRVVCKDGSALARWRPMGLFRRAALRREARLLQRLAGLRGVPAVLGHWPGGLVMEFVPGRMLTSWPRGSVPAEVFDRLDRLLADIHARGVAVGDVHRRNILVDDGLEVHLVDFEVGLDARRGLGRVFGGWMMGLDRFAAVRQRHRFGVALDAAQQERLERSVAGYAAFRRLKRAYSALTGHGAARRRRDAGLGPEPPR